MDEMGGMAGDVDIHGIRRHTDSRSCQWESQDSSLGRRMGTIFSPLIHPTRAPRDPYPEASGSRAQLEKGKASGTLRIAGSQGHTGKDCNIVLIGLVQRVVDNALLIWEAFEDVHTDLVGGESENH